MRRYLKWWGAVAALVSALALIGPLPAHAAAGLRWSAAHVDQQTSINSPDIFALSCPSTTLCVAGDNAGEILTSANPGGGRAAWAAATVETAANSGGLPWINGLSCPSTSLCVAVDQSGRALISTDPSGGATAWSPATISAATRLTAVSCPTTSECVALSGGGQAFSTTSPTGGATAWTGQTIDPGNDLAAVSCPSTTLCAATDAQGNVLTSPGPAGPWTPAHLTQRVLSAISCTAAGLCLATDDDGAVWTSTSPTSGAGAWTRVVLAAGAGTRAAECEDPSFCATGTLGVRYSLTPAVGASWVASSIGLGFEPNVISCVGTSFCAGAGNGEVAVSDSPTTGAWSTPTQIVGTPTLYGVSCPRTTRCYAGDDSGHVLVTSRPTGGATAWTAPGSVTGRTSSGFFGMACPTISLCVAGRDEDPIGTSGSGGSGTYSTNPSGPLSGWKTIPLLHGPDPIVHGFFNAGCAGKSLCAIMSDSGILSISTTPAKAKSYRKITSKAQRLGVFCPRTGRCVAPSGSCPVRSFCADLKTVGDGVGDGRLAVSTDPSRGARSWRTLTIDKGHTLTAISCRSARRCFAVDASGRILSSSRPGTASSWRVAKTVPEALEAISCPSTTLCVAVGADGTAVTGSAAG
jgi:hypothetical protein